jgi:hypothetical protein
MVNGLKIGFTHFLWAKISKRSSSAMHGLRIWDDILSVGMKVVTMSANDDRATLGCIHTTCNYILASLRAIFNEEYALPVVK